MPKGQPPSLRPVGKKNASFSLANKTFKAIKKYRHPDIEERGNAVAFKHLDKGIALGQAVSKEDRRVSKNRIKKKLTGSVSFLPHKLIDNKGMSWKGRPVSKNIEDRRVKINPKGKK